VPNDQLVVGAGGVLANAVVWLDNAQAPQGGSPSDVTLTNTGCRFEPHVATATTGANLALTSRDTFLHNTHGYLGTRTLFNLAIPAAGMTIRRPLAQPGRVTVKCDVHSWMLAHVHVFPHPYHAVSGRNGGFEIRGVPAGTYPVKVWHEQLGEKNASVTVASGVATVDVSY
jgi:plastocyanin